MLTNDDLKCIKKHERFIKNIYLGSEGIKICCEKEDRETKLKINYNIIILKKTEFSLRQKSLENPCKTLSFDFCDRFKSVSSWREILEIDLIDIWPDNARKNDTGIDKKTVIAHFKNKAMFSEQVIVGGKKILFDDQFSFYDWELNVNCDRENIWLCNA